MDNDQQQLQANQTREQLEANIPSGTDYSNGDHDGLATLLRPENHNENEHDPDVQEQDAQGSDNINNGQASPSPSQHNDAETTTNNPKDVSSLLKHLKKGLKYAASWGNLLSFISVTGRTRFPKAHYKILQEAVDTSSHSGETMLSYSSTRDNQNYYFNNFCFPQSSIHYVPCENLPTTLQENISTVEMAGGVTKDVRECVKIVPVSSWAKFDLALHPTYAD